jgi:hypothetical protein
MPQFMAQLNLWHSSAKCTPPCAKLASRRLIPVSVSEPEIARALVQELHRSRFRTCVLKRAIRFEPIRVNTGLYDTCATVLPCGPYLRK